MKNQQRNQLRNKLRNITKFFNNMTQIKRIGIDEKWADSLVTEAGNFVFVGYCMKYEGECITKQIEGAFEVLIERLASVNLKLDNVVKMNCLFKNIEDLKYLPDIIKQKFNGNYPSRIAYTSDFIREGILFQLDAIAYNPNKQ